MSRTFVLFFLMACARLFAQTPGASTLLSVNEGLSQGMVFDILQGSDGYLWIATKDGLNRYDGYHFEVFTNDPFDPFSLSANEIWELFEDSKGWLWINYPGGLDIYVPEIGRFFHLPKQQLPGFIHNNALFAEGPDGSMYLSDYENVWLVEAPKNALEKAWKAGNATLDLHCKKIGSPLGNPTPGKKQFTSLFFHKNQELLVGARNGIYRYDLSGGPLQPLIKTGGQANIVGEDRSGQVWVVANILPDAASEITSSVSQTPAEKRNGWFFCTLKDGALTKRGICARPGNTYRFEGDGYLWETNPDASLLKWQPETLARGGQPSFEWVCKEPFAKTPYFHFTGVEFDHSGINWIGTNGYGIIKINEVKSKFTSYLPLSSQRSLLEDPEGRLITFNDPKQLYNSKKFDRSEANPWLRHIEIHWRLSATFDSGGNCWSNMRKDALYRVDAHTKEERIFPWKGAGLLYTKNGKLLSVAEDGLSTFDPVTEKSSFFPFEKPYKPAMIDFKQYLYEDSDGVIWIFAFEGLLKATPDGAGFRFEHFVNNPADRTSLSNNATFCAADDPLEPHRYLWIGTKGGGLNRLERATGKFTHYKTTEGLPDNVVYGLLSNAARRAPAPSKAGAPPDSEGAGARPGYLWLSTNKGLCRFNVEDFSVKNFTVADGLQSNEFNTSSYLKLRDGTMIFGGVNGLTVFHPDSLRFNENAPQTKIVGIKVNNEPFALSTASLIPHSSSLILSHRQNLLTLSFAALEFSNPTQNQYRYQLIRNGWFGSSGGESWVNLGEKNTVQFANLQPGNYTFRVLGSNNDGIWGTEPAALQFTIRPPWWATWWAYLLYALATGSGVYFFNKTRLRQKLEHQEALRLKDLDDFKNRFFTNITHEFRTPLTIILGTSEQVETKVGIELKDKIKLIRRSGENLLRLINQLLDLAKLESNTLKINCIQGDVLPYLRYISESLHSFANAQNVMLRVESKEREIIMDYDPERLLQIVYNLLSNAIKFTPGGGRVTLSIGMRDEGRGMKSGGTSSLIPHSSSLYLSVTDTGVGIPPEDLPHIFDRFYQANNLEKAKAGGTGIGLALTKELVKAMNGDISAQSEVGKGTVFTVKLPISNKAAASDGVASTSTHAVTPGAVENLGGNLELPPNLNPTDATPSILLIEDNPDVVEYLASCLNESYQLDFAYNGRAGIEKALEIIPDLIVSDVMMPEKDGFEVCEALKNDERCSHIPIVLLTAKAGVENRIAGLKRGADAYLSKPFHKEELLATLENLLEVRRKLQSKYSLSSLSTVPLPPADLEDVFLQKLRTAMEERLGESELTVEDICRTIGMGRSNLYAKLSALTGMSFNIYLRSLRLHRAKELLQSSDMNVSEVAYKVGFNDPKYFSRVFSEVFGVSPSEVRNS